MGLHKLSEYRKYRAALSLYNNGMNMAQTLRELSMDDEAHAMEVWVLAMRKQLTEKTDSLSDCSTEEMK